MKKKLIMVIVSATLLMTGCAGLPLPGLDRQQDDSGSAQDGEALSQEDPGRTLGNRLDGNAGGEEADNSTQNPDGTGGTDKEGDADEGASVQAMGGYVRGITTDTGWESEFWGLRYTAPEGLYMMNEEGLNMMMGLSQDALSDSYDERQLEYMKLTSVYEMMSTTQAGDANVVITAEKLMMKNLKSEDYADAVRSQLDTLYGSQYTLKEGEETAEIGGENYCVIRYSVDSTPSYYQDCYVRVKDDRAISMIITYQDATEETAASILEGFGVY